MARDTRGFLLHTLGPGLLFAGAAIGVSHLVQSTRAGAVYGFGLLLVIIVANIVKYPAFSFGPHYAAATGTSLLEGYRRQGRWALVLYTLLTLSTMFTVLAAVTVVTAGLAKALLLAVVAVVPAGLARVLLVLDTSIVVVSATVMAVCMVILVAGKYHWLDRIMKIVVAALTVLTVVATILVLPKIDWSEFRLWPRADQWNMQTAAFVAPLVGWMPSAIDIAVWHSLWTLAKRRDTRRSPTLDASLLDFKIGYIGTAFLAICFMLLGAGVLYGSGVTLAASAGGFASQVIALYTATLGDWSRYLIGSAAFAVMFSTTLTVLDGFPRALAALYERFRGPEIAGASAGGEDSRPVYWGSMVVLAAGGVAIIHYIARLDFKLLIDIATALAVLTAPALAILNHRAVLSVAVPEELRPSQRMRRFSLLCIVLLSAFAAWWLYVSIAA
jgi:Mn2+/Fe2+ NRAMP family transporter